ncbi:MAG: CD225/dispanin family protein [Muribaculaceae bacterium]|nr:CD225/dispanin family protein [Muribaculaceae bacterium]
MKFWIYQDGAQKGPFTILELFEMNVTPQTPVWFEGLDKWRPASEIDSLQALLRGDRTPYEADAASEGEVPPTTDRIDAVLVEEVVETEPLAQAEEPQEPKKPASKYAPGRRAPRRTELPDEPCPPTYLGWSIFLTVCCCSPVSLASLVASIFVSTYYNSGRLDKSRRASNIAAWLIMVAIALGFLPMFFLSALTGN